MMETCAAGWSAFQPRLNRGFHRRWLRPQAALGYIRVLCVLRIDVGGAADEPVTNDHQGEQLCESI